MREAGIEVEMDPTAEAGADRRWPGRERLANSSIRSMTLSELKASRSYGERPTASWIRFANRVPDIVAVLCCLAGLSRNLIEVSSRLRAAGTKAQP